MTFFIIIVTNDLDVCSVFPDNDKMNTAGVTGWRRVLSLLWHLILPLFFFLLEKVRVRFAFVCGFSWFEQCLLYHM